MSDAPEMLPAWMVDELRRPIEAREERKARLLDMLAALPPVSPARRHRRAWRRPSGRRGVLGASAALALAACTLIAVASAGLVHSLLRAPAGGARVEVIGDTVVGTLHDTLRLVRLVLDAPAASRVTLASVTGDARVARTPLSRSRSGAWSAVLPLAPGRYTFRFVADDARATDVPVVVARRTPRAPRARPISPAGGDST